MLSWRGSVDFWVETIGRKPLYTERLLVHVFARYGHRQVDPGTRGAVCLVSLCDITEIGKLARIRARYPDNILLSGGHLAKIGALVMGLHSDLVWVGHCFDAAACVSIDEIADHPSCYRPGQSGDVIASIHIDWRMCPLIQTDRRRYYIFGGVGCRRKCRYCLTSHTEIHRDRPGLSTMVKRARGKLAGSSTIKVISNAYTPEVGDSMVLTMMLSDFVKVRLPMRNRVVRCGIEFATDRTRARYAKPIKVATIAHAIRHAEKVGAKLHLFHIGGIDSIEDWLGYVGSMPESDRMSPQVYLKWTNLEYQQKTPIWTEAKSPRFDRYLTSANTDEFFRVAAHRNKRIRVMPVKYPAHAIWRTIMSNVSTREQYELAYAHRNTKEMDTIIDLYNDLRPWETDLNHIKVGREAARAWAEMGVEVEA